MSTDVKTEDGKSIVVRELGKTTRMVNRIFRGIFLVIYMFSIVACIYWTMASDRYVSEAVVLVQNTETGGVGRKRLGRFRRKGIQVSDPATSRASEKRRLVRRRGGAYGNSTESHQDACRVRGSGFHQPHFPRSDGNKIRGQARSRGQNQ